MIWAQGAKPCIHWFSDHLGIFPFGSGGAAYMVCVLSPVLGQLPREMNSTPFGGGSDPALPLTWFGHVGAYGPMLRGPPATPLLGAINPRGREMASRIRRPWVQRMCVE